MCCTLEFVRCVVWFEVFCRRVAKLRLTEERSTGLMMERDILLVSGRSLQKVFCELCRAEVCRVGPTGGAEQCRTEARPIGL